ncbi:UDP-4-amino-4,6-dideoxy-N-acetyl-beta-L-altrosamine transaminase [Amylibacter sp.]|nr:UDP-4-amino-4,6-dideoxy-N-acetyl-beta-L-altrosamine transaminase [Amylibacter sp.]
MIPYSCQSISEDDIDAVVKVLRSELLTQGPTIPLFENAICDYTGSKYGVAVNSATSALHIACLALGLGEGDILWTTPNSFVASSNCALYCNAKVDFVDIDPATWNMCVDALEQKLIYAKKRNLLPKIIIPVHLCGLSCDMEKIQKLSEEYGFYIIEDASHAIGGYYQGKPIGSSYYSDITVFSFHPVKIITAGEGGMAMTNNKDLATKMGLFRSHGITRDGNLMHATPDGPWYYEQVDLGYNYRLTDIHAALGLSQFKKVDKFVQKRNDIANRYDICLQKLPIISQLRPDNYYSAMHLYVIRLQLNKLERSHLEIFNELRNDILVNLHYMPIHLQPWYKKMGFRKGDFPNAELYYKEAISIPCFPNLTGDQFDFVIEKLHNVIN